MASVSLIVAAVITAAIGWWMLYSAILIVTLAIVGLLGIPIFQWIRARSCTRANWWTIGMGGTMAGGFFPALLIILPRLGTDRASIGDTATVIDGHYTLAGWLDAFTIIGGFGLLGALGAWLSWALTLWLSRGRGRVLGLGVLVVLAVAASMAIPSAARDRSCHNPLRDGGNSIGLVASFDLSIRPADWPEVRDEFARFAGEGGWSIRSDVRTDPDFLWFQVSLCREPGTNIFVTDLPADASVGTQEVPHPDRLSIGVFQPQGGDSWKAQFRKLHRRLQRRWPGAISYRNSDGTTRTVQPDWVSAEPAAKAPPVARSAPSPSPPVLRP